MHSSPDATTSNPAAPVSANRWNRLALVAAVLALTACGGSDEAGGDTSSPTPAPAPAPAPAPVPTPPPPPAAAVPVIGSDLPTTLNVREGDTGTLTVAASSPDSSSLSYRWLRNGTEIPSAGTTASTAVASTLFATSYPAETWQVEVRNAAGATLSAITSIQRSPREWLDVGTAHADRGPAQESGARQLASLVDPAGRVHIASVHEDPVAGTLVTFTGVSRDSAADTWAYTATLPASASGAEITDLSLSSTYTGEIVAAWLETVQGSVDRYIVRAALYRPGATAAQPGSWTPIGTVSNPELQASEPTVVNVGAGAFGIAWLQRSAAGQPRSAVLRRYDVPAAGSEAGSGLGSTFDIETISADISRLQLVDAGIPMALLFVEASGSTSARWQYSIGGGGTAWAPLADLAVDDRFSRIDWAPPVNGVTVLATADGNGRLFTRRVDIANRSFLDGGWSYTANAYGSPPALLIDGEGRIDVFGVAVATASGHTSALGHWVFTPSAGWGPATVLAQSATDFREGLGLRQPLVGRDDFGNLVLTWLERASPTTAQRLRVQRYSRFSAAWTAASDLAAPATGSTRQLTPVLSVNGSGRATAAWVEQPVEGDARLRHARLR